MRLLCLALALVLAGCAGAPAPPMASDPSPEAQVTPAGAAPLVEPPPGGDSGENASADDPPCPAPTEAVAGACRAWLGEPGVDNLEASLAVDPRDARRALVAWTVRTIPRVADVSLGTTARVHAALTEDGGATWTTTMLADPAVKEVPGAERFSFDQRAHFGRDGVARVLYVGDTLRANAAGDMARLTLASSDDGGRSWAYARIAELPGARFDYTALAEAPDTGALYVAVGEQVSRGVWLFRSEDGGATWSMPVVAHATAAPMGYHGLASLVALPEDVVLVTTTVQAHPDAPAARGLAVARSTDGGKSFAPSVLVARTPYDALDNMPSTGAALRVGGSRALALVAHEEGGLYAVESADAGESWAEPVRVAGGSPTWAVVALSPEGGWATLHREDGGDGSRYLLTHALSAAPAALLSLPGGGTPFGGNAGDDYGGLAIAPDATLWAAYALAEETGSRIAVYTVPPGDTPNAGDVSGAGRRG